MLSKDDALKFIRVEFIRARLNQALKYYQLPPLEVLQSQWSRFVLVRALKSCVCLFEGGATNTTAMIASCDCERNYHLVVVLLQMCFPHSTQSTCAVCDLQQHISRETFLCLFFDVSISIKPIDKL